MGNSSQRIESFYVSGKWRNCRTAFAKSKGNLCERCLQRGILETGTKDQPLETHHKIPLTPENIDNPEIALSWDNLELLCKKCHDEEKKRKTKRWKIGPDGRVQIAPLVGAK